MTTKPSKYQELENRTYLFAKRCRDFVKVLPKSTAHIEYGKQLIRSSGSQAANYIEANESASKKDFIYRIRVCRKESKETDLWLDLCEPVAEQEKEKDLLKQECSELRSIFSAIISKTSK